MPRQDMHISPVARSGQHNRLIQGRLTDMNGVVHKGNATPVTDVYGYSYVILYQDYFSLQSPLL